MPGTRPLCHPILVTAARPLSRTACETKDSRRQALVTQADRRNTGQHHVIRSFGGFSGLSHHVTCGADSFYVSCSDGSLNRLSSFSVGSVGSKDCRRRRLLDRPDSVHYRIVRAMPTERGRFEKVPRFVNWVLFSERILYVTGNSSARTLGQPPPDDRNEGQSLVRFPEPIEPQGFLASFRNPLLW